MLYKKDKMNDNLCNYYTAQMPIFKYRVQRLLVPVMILCCLSFSDAVKADVPKELAGGWRLVWHDEFDGNKLDSSKWVAEDAALEKNNEGEYYTPEDVSVHDGFLTLRSEKRDMGGRHYTSGLVETRGKFARVYGRFEIRAKLPKGQGIWPAHWLMPDDDSWPPEIDIMELIGHYPNRIYMTNHFTSAEGGPTWHGDSFTGSDFSKDFHVFAVEWEPDEIRWYIDGVERFSTKENIPNVPMRIILNTAVGGDWPGYPTKKTVFPQFHDIDYVRVYAKINTSIEFADPKDSA